MITWSVNAVNVADEQGYIDVIKQVEFSVSDGFNSVIGIIDLPAPQGNFLEYRNLSEQNVISFVQSALGDKSSEYEQALNVRASNANLTSGKKLPWIEGEQL